VWVLHHPDRNFIQIAFYRSKKSQMKSQLIYGLLALFAWQACNLKHAGVVKESSAKQQIIKDTINFSSRVQPIMIKNCSPCHFPGGKMYERMPFDKDTTIINHGEKILKRIKDDEENSLLKKFLIQNKNGSH
jgi:hypothetical protein